MTDSFAKRLLCQKYKTSNPIYLEVLSFQASKWLAKKEILRQRMFHVRLVSNVASIVQYLACDPDVAGSAQD